MPFASGTCWNFIAYNSHNLLYLPYCDYVRNAAIFKLSIIREFFSAIKSSNLMLQKICPILVISETSIESPVIFNNTYFRGSILCALYETVYVTSGGIFWRNVRGQIWLFFKILILRFTYWECIREGWVANKVALCSFSNSFNRNTSHTWFLTQAERWSVACNVNLASMSEMNKILRCAWLNTVLMPSQVFWSPGMSSRCNCFSIEWKNSIIKCCKNCVCECIRSHGHLLYFEKDERDCNVC